MFLGQGLGNHARAVELAVVVLGEVQLSVVCVELLLVGKYANRSVWFKFRKHAYSTKGKGKQRKEVLKSGPSSSQKNDQASTR